MMNEDTKAGGMSPDAFNKMQLTLTKVFQAWKSPDYSHEGNISVVDTVRGLVELENYRDQHPNAGYNPLEL